jgi:Domain of unknown function (DUF4398)
MTPMPRKIHLVASVFSLLLTACATAPPPQADLDDAARAVASARDADAGDNAPVELRFAESKLERSRAAVAAKDAKNAVLLAQQATADAELALAKSRNAKARAAVQAKTRENAKLRHELLGTGDHR